MDACVQPSAGLALPATYEPSGGEAISAQLLLNAQEQLREQLRCSSVPPCSMFAASTPAPFLFPPCEQRLPKMPSMDSSAACTQLATPFMPTGFAEPPGAPRASAAHASMVVGPPLPREECSVDETAPKRGREYSEEEEGTDVSSSEGNSRSSHASTAGCCKRLRRSAARADPALVAGLFAERQALQERCCQLQSTNARLMCHLSLTLRMLHKERAAAQAEAERLRQKCHALGAFLPPSVAAFARGIPAGSDMFTRKAALLEQLQPN